MPTNERFPGAVLLALLIAGCPGPEEPRDAGLDVLGGLDAPTTDVPAADDAPVGTDGGTGDGRPITADEAARFLAVASACPGTSQSGLSDRGIAGVIAAARERASFGAMVRCVGTAGTDCGAVLRCGMRAGVIDGVCDRTACEGDLLRLCLGPPGSPNSRATIDCSVLGQTCVAGEGIAFGCGTPCTETTCEGMAGLACSSGVGVPITCSDGFVCTTTGSTIACSGGGGACAAHACAGAMFTECDPVNHQTLPPRDCAEVNGTCDETRGCVPSASECTADATEPTCDGSVVTYCSPSHTRETLDCASLGFNRCLVATGSGTYCLE